MACDFTDTVLQNMRLVLSREWVRRQGALHLFDEAFVAGELPEHFSADPKILKYTEAVVEACKQGGVAPGCTDAGMDWYAFACFARWYAWADESFRPIILGEIGKGNATPWIASGMPPEPKPCADSKTLWCCPPEVYEDKFYVESLPEEDKATTLVILGLAGAAALGALWWFRKGK